MESIGRTLKFSTAARRISGNHTNQQKRVKNRITRARLFFEIEINEFKLQFSNDFRKGNMPGDKVCYPHMSDSGLYIVDLKCNNYCNYYKIMLKNSN